MAIVAKKRLERTLYQSSLTELFGLVYCSSDDTDMVPVTPHAMALMTTIAAIPYKTDFIFLSSCGGLQP